MSHASPLFVLGRFPPPTDGQTVATARMADLLEGPYAVRRLSSQAPGLGPLAATPDFDARRTLHFLTLRRTLRRALAEHPTAPVLWPAISPSPLGHWRDVVATAPALGPSRPVAGIVHRVGFEALFDSVLTAPTARRLVARLDALVFLSQALSDACADVVPEAKRRVIPNTIRDALVVSSDAVAGRQRRGPGTPFRVLFLSNMLPEKGYADVLEGVAQVAGDGADIHATFVGRWPDALTREAFEARAHALGVGDAITVTGSLNDPADLKSLYLEADVFALPTVHPTEAQPITILEALSAGTPVITVDRPVLRALVTDGREGRLVPPHAPEAIAAALRELMAPARWLAASEAARSRFEAEFSPEVVGARWRGLADTLASS